MASRAAKPTEPEASVDETAVAEVEAPASAEAPAKPTEPEASVDGVSADDDGLVKLTSPAGTEVTVSPELATTLLTSGWK